MVGKFCKNVILRQNVISGRVIFDYRSDRRRVSKPGRDKSWKTVLTTCSN